MLKKPKNNITLMERLQIYNFFDDMSEKKLLKIYFYEKK